jgi:hypothetical protein
MKKDRPQLHGKFTVAMESSRIQAAQNGTVHVRSEPKTFAAGFQLPKKSNKKGSSSRRQARRYAHRCARMGAAIGSLSEL